MSVTEKPISGYPWYLGPFFLESLTLQIEQAMLILPETLPVYGYQAVGGYFPDFDINRDATVRYDNLSMLPIAGVRALPTGM